MDKKALGSKLGSTAALLLCALSLPVAAQTADFPAKPVRIVVPYAPGGAVDLLARFLSPKMHERLGQPVLVENRPGAGGNTATEAVARAEPDGYTAVLGANYITMTPLFTKQPAYALDDFATVGKVAAQPVLIAVNAKSSIGTLQEFIAAGRQRELTYGTPGVGTPHHFFVEHFARKVGIRVLHVPYKGAGPAVADLVAGRIDFSLGGETTLAGPAVGGALRQLAVLDDQRLASLPGIPTAAEGGAPGVKAHFWYGLFAPAKTPAGAVARLNRALNDTLGDPELQSQLRQRGYVPAEAKPPHAFMAELRAELSEWDQFSKSGFRKVGD